MKIFLRRWRKSWRLSVGAIDICTNNEPYLTVARRYEIEVGRLVFSFEIPVPPRGVRRAFIWYWAR
jgi:hypothetical protein